jgi:hypothetical protein
MAVQMEKKEEEDKMSQKKKEADEKMMTQKQEEEEEMMQTKQEEKEKMTQGKEEEENMQKKQEAEEEQKETKEEHITAPASVTIADVVKVSTGTAAAVTAPAVIVTEATDADVDAITHALFAAFAEEPYFHALYPGGNTPAGRAAAAARIRADMRDFRAQTILKAVDAASGAIMGSAFWIVHAAPRPEAEWRRAPVIDWYPAADDPNATDADRAGRRAAEAFLGVTYGFRQAFWEGRPHVCKCYTLNKKKAFLQVLRSF